MEAIESVGSSKCSLLEEIHQLAKARVLKGISLVSIAEETKIGLRYLSTIEEGKLDKLPGGVYRINYLRQYANRIDQESFGDIERSMRSDGG